MTKLGFGFPEDPPIQKLRSRAQCMFSREAQISMQEDLYIPKFVETLISSRGRGERVSPCESCPIQASFDTMLIFHMLR